MHRRGYGTGMMRLVLVRWFKNPAVSAVLVDPLASHVRAHRSRVMHIRGRCRSAGGIAGDFDVSTQQVSVGTRYRVPISWSSYKLDDDFPGKVEYDDIVSLGARFHD